MSRNCWKRSISYTSLEYVKPAWAIDYICFTQSIHLIVISTQPHSLSNTYHFTFLVHLYYTKKEIDNVPISFKINPIHVSGLVYTSFFYLYIHKSYQPLDQTFLIFLSYMDLVVNMDESIHTTLLLSAS